MMGHQRDVLASLGIDIWIPRASVCSEKPVQSIWRDRAVAEEILSVELSSPVIKQVDSIDHAVSNIPDVPQHVVQQPQSGISPVEHDVLERTPIEVAPFALQALRLEHCCILIHATELTQQQQQLWANIQNALAAEFNELQWPFAWEQVQDGRGVASYVSGFVDIMAQGRPILCLGDIPHLVQSNIMQLASLEEMLQQPILKKRLWSFMQKNP